LGEQECMYDVSVKAGRKYHYEDEDIDGWIILKLNLEK
jgi:hypothetical protein